MALADAAVRDRMFHTYEQLKDSIEDKSLRNYTNSAFRDAQITIIRLYQLFKAVLQSGAGKLWAGSREKPALLFLSGAELVQAGIYLSSRGV